MTVTETRGPGRPPLGLEQSESQQLHRIADLSIAILRSLRAVGRGRFDSERRLRAWLTSDGVPFSQNELAPALALLEANGQLTRGRVGLGQPRPGWLPTELDKPDIPPRIRLARLVIEVIQSGGGPASAAVIAERLAEADEEVSEAQLAETLRRLVDCDQLQILQRQSEIPRYNPRGRWAFDVTDDLEADIMAVLRSREELGYETEEQLREWVGEAGVEITDDRLWGLAIDHLARIGRLETPSAARWTGPGPRVTWMNEPKPWSGDEW